jgi:hypothetical protein
MVSSRISIDVFTYEPKANLKLDKRRAVAHLKRMMMMTAGGLLSWQVLVYQKDEDEQS